MSIGAVLHVLQHVSYNKINNYYSMSKKRPCLARMLRRKTDGRTDGQADQRLRKRKRNGNVRSEEWRLILMWKLLLFLIMKMQMLICAVPLPILLMHHHGAPQDTMVLNSRRFWKPPFSLLEECYCCNFTIAVITAVGNDFLLLVSQQESDG